MLIKVNEENLKNVENTEIDFFSEEVQVLPDNRCNVSLRHNNLFMPNRLTSKEYINKILNLLVSQKGKICNRELMEEVNFRLKELSNDYYNPYIRFSVIYNEDYSGLFLCPFTIESVYFIFDYIDIFNKVIQC